MPIDTAKVQRSFKEISANGDALVARFQGELFQRRPEFRDLFKNVTPHEQRRKFLFALAFVVRNLDRPDTLSVYLGGLGAAHVHYGVAQADYPLLVECLLAALREAAGDTWTPETEQLWKETLGVVASLMIEGITRPPLVYGPPTATG